MKIGTAKRVVGVRVKTRRIKILFVGRAKFGLVRNLLMVSGFILSQDNNVGCSTALLEVI